MAQSGTCLAAVLEHAIERHIEEHLKRVDDSEADDAPARAESGHAFPPVVRLLGAAKISLPSADRPALDRQASYFAADSAAPASSASDGGLPPGWTALQDDEGDTYYHNEV